MSAALGIVYLGGVCCLAIVLAFGVIEGLADRRRARREGFEIRFERRPRFREPRITPKRAR